MADKPTTTEPKTTEPQQTTDLQGHEDSGGQPAENWRNEPGARAMANQITDLRKQIDDMKAEQKRVTDKEEEDRLKAQQDWQTLEQKKNDRIAALEKQLASRDRRDALNEKLSGIVDPDKRRLFVSDGMDQEDIDKYYDDLKTNRPDLWESPGVRAASTAAPGGKSEGGGSNSEAELEKRAANGDRAALKELVENDLKDLGVVV